MPTPLCELQRHHTPDWRYQLARELSNSTARRIKNRVRDRITLLNAAYFLKQQRCPVPRGMGLPSDLESLAVAHRLALDSYYNPLRTEIEARILAEQSSDEIAAVTGVPVSILDLFTTASLAVVRASNFADSPHARSQVASLDVVSSREL